MAMTCNSGSIGDREGSRTRITIGECRKVRCRRRCAERQPYSILRQMIERWIQDAGSRHVRHHRWEGWAGRSRVVPENGGSSWPISLEVSEWSLVCIDIEQRDEGIDDLRACSLATSELARRKDDDFLKLWGCRPRSLLQAKTATHKRRNVVSVVDPPPALFITQSQSMLSRRSPSEGDNSTYPNRFSACEA